MLRKTLIAAAAVSALAFATPVLATGSNNNGWSCGHKCGGSTSSGSSTSGWHSSSTSGGHTSTSSSSGGHSSTSSGTQVPEPGSLGLLGAGLLGLGFATRRRRRMA